MPIRILDPDPEQGPFFKIYCNFLTTRNFQIFVLCYAKFDEPLRNQKKFYDLSFYKVHIWI